MESFAKEEECLVRSLARSEQRVGSINGKFRERGRMFGEEPSQVGDGSINAKVSRKRKNVW